MNFIGVFRDVRCFWANDYKLQKIALWNWVPYAYTNKLNCPSDIKEIKSFVYTTMKILLIYKKSHDNADFRNRWLKSFEQGTFVTSKNHWSPPTLCLFFTGNCPIKPPCCLCGHIIRSSCFIGYYYKAFQAFFCNHIIQFHDHFLLIIKKINSISFRQLPWNITFKLVSLWSTSV